MIRKLRKIYTNIRRIIYWLPIIWKDRYWDSAFLLQIIRAKLRYDAARYKNHVGSEIHAEQMWLAANLCKRLREQDYITPWDNERIEACDGLWNYMENHTEIMGNGMVFHTSKGFEQPKHLRDRSKWVNEREDEMKKQDLEYLCRILRKHLFSWWD